MDRLWAPWRMSYVANNPDSTQPRPASDTSPALPRNFIADALASDQDRINLLVCRTDLSVVMLNRFPYNNGHLLVAPKRPVADLQDLTDAESLDLQKTLTRMISTLKRLMRPDGFNVGLNLDVLLVQACRNIFIGMSSHAGTATPTS